MKIGNVECGKFALAPMAGISDSPFRQTCKSFGMTYCVSEMISTRALCYQDRKTHELLVFNPTERPIAIQLFGNEPLHFAKAAEIAINRVSPDIIDINMGCPSPKIYNNGDGSALMNDIKRAECIIKAAVKASAIPVTVKMRLGVTNTDECVDFAKMIEEAGAAAVTVHGRTKVQMYRYGISYDCINQIKNSVSIPVIGNGDVADISGAKAMFDTGCDMIMVGRGTLGCPWIFSDLINESEISMSINEKIIVINRHIELMIDKYGERNAMLQARKHIAWYCKSYRNASLLKSMAYKVSSYDDLLEIFYVMENKIL